MSKYTYASNGEWIIRMSNKSKHHEQIFYMCKMVINENPSTISHRVSVELSWSKIKDDAIFFIQGEGQDIIDSVIKHPERTYSLARKQ